MTHLAHRLIDPRKPKAACAVCGDHDVKWIPVRGLDYRGRMALCARHERVPHIRYPKAVVVSEEDLNEVGDEYQDSHALRTRVVKLAERRSAARDLRGTPPAA